MGDDMNQASPIARMIRYMRRAFSITGRADGKGTPPNVIVWSIRQAYAMLITITNRIDHVKDEIGKS